MIKHIVMWKLKENAEGNLKWTNAALIKKGLEGLKGKVPQIKNIQVGIAYRHENEDWDVVLISEFETLKDLKEYQNHPEHNIVNEFIKKVKSERACVDFEEKN